ncbi:MAG TPA: enolase C-terminal domain-like protein [Candidatus Dormibacteraeota bacterium]|nr:enolase C-terminal domain-like protein [Candidatus Dormibacteraeota bacterium]
MARVEGVSARSVVVPMRRALRTSTGAVAQAPLLLIDLHCSGGVSGRAYLFGIQPFTLAPLRSLVESLFRFIADAELVPLELEATLRSRLTLHGPIGLAGMALAGLDMAAWDALARIRDVPLAALLGGSVGRVPAYNSNGLGIMPRAEAAAEAAALLDGGFSAVKVRLGRPDAGDDLETVRAVRSAIGAGAVLMADFNQYLSIGEALVRCALLDGEGLAWIEEPVRTDDLAGCARVAAEVRTPVQIGENFSGPFQMREALAMGASDLVMPDLQRIGGVTGWLRAAALAHAFGVEMSSHLFPEFSAHLLRVTPTAHWLEYVDWAAPVLRSPLEVDGGHVVVPDRPGAGLEWDEEAVARFSV